MREPDGYATPAAFRRALTDRLKALASASRWPLPQLQRQIAYDRLLERLYLADDQWIVKGATALLARDLGVRATIDVDLYRPQAGQKAEAQLRAAAQRDIGDWFRFEIGPAQPITAGTTSRLPVTALVGATLWVSFHVDLAGDDLQMTGRPDDVPALARVLMPGIQQHGYRAYPLVDHIADKLAAIFERHGTLRAPSTRFKDLVDLVAILTRISVQADSQQQALESEAERRGFTLPGQFDVPDHQLWVTGYRAEARRSLLTIAGTLDEATGIVRPFADPLLERTAAGRWEPATGRWSGNPATTIRVMKRRGRVPSGDVENLSSVPISSETADAALSCPALTRARNLAEWVGQGRTLTASGVLRPAEAVQACRDLGIELPGPRLRSALDVEDLMQDWTTAAAAGFLEMSGRRVRAAEDLPDAGSSTHRDPDAILHAWVQAATVVLDLGDQPCAACLIVLNELYSADGPLTMGQLASAVRALEPEEPEGLPCPGCGEVHGPGDLLGFGDFLSDEDEDEDAASHTADTVTGLLWFGAADVADEAVQLTSLGTVLTASVFQGREPSPDADVATVMSAVSGLPPAVARTVAQPWLDARSAAEAVGELLAFAESADGGQRVAALALAGELGSDAADAWREWAKRPGIGAYARQWLRSQGEQVPEDPADEAWLAVDGLSVMLDALADTVPPFLIQAMLAQEFGEEVTGVAEQMLRSGHPRAQDIAARLTGRPALAAVGGSAVTRGSAPARQSQPGRSGRSGVAGQSSGARKRRPGSGTLVHQLKITLGGVSRPPVWRRVLVPADVTLGDLHQVIQQAMGWDDYHMHLFSVGGQEYGSPDPELGHASDRNVLLSRVLTSPGDRLSYTYDFGDGWEHDIVLEETRPAVPEETYPSCVAGKGACPPEDCGGAWGYAELKETLADPSHEGHQDMLEWLGLDAGKDFDPKEFSVTDVNARLTSLAKAW